MKAKSVVLCAVILLVFQLIAFAQKTEVSVRKGKVVAETQTASVNIDAGQKAVLRKDANPLVTVDSPLVQDALELYKLIEKEKQQSDLKIDSIFIMVGKADEDEVVGALYFEVPNHNSQPTDVLTLGPMSILEDFRVYDMNGNLCSVEEERVGETAVRYTIHLAQQVQPGEYFKLVGVTNLEDIPVFPGGAPAHWREGPLVYFRTANHSPNCLIYYRFILPESAILVDANREIVATDTVDGRLAVTMRNYTGPYADGLCMIALLFPDEDGTTLADIPGKYHGLWSKQDKQNSETYRREMHKVRAGIKYTDQSTPLAAMLTIFGSAVQGDTDLYSTVKYTSQAPDTIRKWIENSKYYVDRLDFLSTPQWPDNPGNGYVHPVYFSRKGSLIDEFISPMVYEDGKWYVHNTKQRPSDESEDVTANKIAAAKRKGYLCDWEVAGPYIEKGKKGTELFDIPFGPELPDADVRWQPISIESHEQHPAYLDLDEVLFNFDQAVAYLRTEIVSDKQKPVRLEIYTDDGVKAWLNGKQVHANNISRGIQEQPDTVDVTLNEGTNHLMLKVTDDVWAWGAIVRLVEP